MILTLNRIIKLSSESDKVVRLISLKLVEKLQLIFPHKFPYIDSLTKASRYIKSTAKLQDKAFVHRRIAHHPVHILDQDGRKSAFRKLEISRTISSPLPTTLTESSPRPTQQPSPRKPAISSSRTTQQPLERTSAASSSPRTTHQPSPMARGLQDEAFVQRITNHPVHIVDQDGRESASAFIPFCEFGGDMSLMGVKTEKFSQPVCNSFKPKVMKDQLCYQVDISELIQGQNKNNMAEILKSGVIFLLDYNEDRQVYEEESFSVKKDPSLLQNIVGEDDSKTTKIYLDTKG